MKTAANYDRHIVPEWQPVWDEESGRGRMGLLRFVQVPAVQVRCIH
jgi:hypothetical protein